MSRRLHLVVSAGTFLIVLTSLIAAGLRMVDLHRWPMTDAEAVHALAALAASPQPSQFWLDGQAFPPISPAHYALTSLLFPFFGSSEVTARIIPALFGAGLIVLTALMSYRSQLIGLLTALFMALSSVLITTSRTSGGAMISGFALFLIVMIGATELKWKSPGHQITLVAFGLGLGFASGLHFYTGLLSLLLLLALVFALGRRSSLFRDHGIFSLRLGGLSRGDWLLAMALMLITSLGFGALFGLRSGGLAGIPEALGAWLRGWASAADFHPLTLLFMLPIYDTLLVFFALIGLLSSIRKREVLGLTFALWSLTALLVVMAYPGRSAEDLLWVTLPLCFLAALGLMQLVQRILAVDNWLVFLGFSAALLVLLVFSYLQLAAHVQNPNPPPSEIGLGISYLELAFFALGLCGVVGVMIGLGWSWDMARISVGSATAMLFCAFSISAIWGLNFRPSAASARELWRPEASTIGLPMMARSLETISQAQTGLKQALPVQLYDAATPSLAWELRQFSSYEQAASGVEASPVVLTLAQESEPQLRADYIGQSFKIAEIKGWASILPPDFLQWLIQRNPPTVPQRWLLLLRQDLTGAEVVEELDLPEP